jgi:hypothetical protein
MEEETRRSIGLSSCSLARCYDEALQDADLGYEGLQRAYTGARCLLERHSDAWSPDEKGNQGQMWCVIEHAGRLIPVKSGATLWGDHELPRRVVGIGRKCA